MNVFSQLSNIMFQHFIFTVLIEVGLAFLMGEGFTIPPSFLFWFIV